MVSSNTQQESPYKKTQDSVWGKYLFFGILSSLLIVGIYQFGYERGQTKYHAVVESSQIENKLSQKDGVAFDLFWETWDLLNEKYVDANALDGQEMLYGAIQGMLASSGDPHTSFFDPVDVKSFTESMEGSFEGIGAEIGRKQGVPVVVAPLDNSPSQKSGVRSGDLILKIDGIDTMNMSLDEAVSKMRGPKSTEVVLTVYREGEDQTQDITIIRDVISIESVHVEFLDGGIASVRISRFGEDTAVNFRQVVKEIKDRNAQGIILDLRNNPGGLLDASVNIAEHMLPAGEVVLIEENRKGEQKKVYTRSGNGLTSIPTVILLNQGSASASEILAGALRENRDNVQIIGKVSFGKGSVQEFVPLMDGTAVKITVAKWLTPKGSQIHGVGVSPDIEVDISNEDYENQRDPQMDKAQEVIRSMMGN